MLGARNGAVVRAARSTGPVAPDGDVQPLRDLIVGERAVGQLGFALDLTRCAATGAASDLAYVSPRSAQAVSRDAGAPYRDKLLRLPQFLLAGGPAP